jgi:spore maturation protein CgeB
MRLVILGLTITSSWGNGHATTYRSLCRALAARGHHIDFVEKNVEWYESHRDLPHPSYAHTSLYADWESEGRSLTLRLAKEADLVVIGSYFPDAIAATELLLHSATVPVAFYDIDTPITLARLRAHGATEYLRAEHIPLYSAYMSFTGGPALRELETAFGSPMARPLYCSVDPASYFPVAPDPRFEAELSYLGTYAADRQPKLMQLLNASASALPSKHFLVGGPMYPHDTVWAPNVRTLWHVPPAEHAAFYSSAHWTLNLTRDEMVRAGYSPSVRLFEASACGAAILSDPWEGMECFLTPGEEIVTATSTEEAVAVLRDISDEERARIAGRARERILASHTAAHRALEFEQIVSGMRTSARVGAP